MLLSVVIPVYNAEKYIVECLRSVVSQSFSDLEVILVNDGSKDNSLEICESFAEHDCRIKVLTQKNQGPIEARKNGVSKTKGDYIMFIDSDDYLSDGALDKICYKINDTHADIVQFDYRIVDNYGVHKEDILGNYTEGFYDKNAIREKISPSMMYAGLFHKFGVAPSLWNKVFKKHLITEYIYDVPKEVFFGEDGLVTYQCILKADSIYIMKDVFFYNYRENPQSICRTYTLNRLSQNIPLLRYYHSISDFNEQPLKSELANYAVYMSWLGIKEAFWNMFQAEKSILGQIKQLKEIEAFLPDDIAELFKEQKWNGITRKNKLLIGWVTNRNILMIWLYMRYQCRKCLR